MTKLKDRKIEELKCCPYCKSTSGYYLKIQYSGSGIYRFPFSKTEEETLINDDMYDCLSNDESKYYYCLNCDKRIAPNTH